MQDNLFNFIIAILCLATSFHRYLIDKVTLLKFSLWFVLRCVLLSGLELRLANIVDLFPF